ncbi:MAG: Lrp/AsnC family transcriptional regulator [Deltaproteobacteria bacterium]|nr:Lrp/AsnC family transcriptional regulator [Deltaproteobacteria bacterium]
MHTHQTPDAFKDWERTILGLAQGDIPESLTPFADMAQAAGSSESQALELFKDLKNRMLIRRFGATLRHQKAGYGHNAMVAWMVPEERVDEFGRHLSALAEVTHCYLRKATDAWPYNIYSMVHSMTPAGSLHVVESICQSTGVNEYEILSSVEELKKTSMRYF